MTSGRCPSTASCCSSTKDLEPQPPNLYARLRSPQPGVDLSRTAVIAHAEQGGWHAMPERPIDPDARRSRSIDVMLERIVRREVAVVEIVDLITDAGATFRGHSDKVHALRREARPDWQVAGLLVVRGKRRNRDLVRSLRSVIADRYPARSIAWLAALRDPNRPMPRTAVSSGPVRAIQDLGRPGSDNWISGTVRDDGQNEDQFGRGAACRAAPG